MPNFSKIYGLHKLKTVNYYRNNYNYMHKMLYLVEVSSPGRGTVLSIRVVGSSPFALRLTWVGKHYLVYTSKRYSVGLAYPATHGIGAIGQL